MPACLPLRTVVRTLARTTVRAFVLAACGALLAERGAAQSVAQTAGDALAPAAAPDVRDLPLTELPASTAANGTLAIFLTGDGGWASLDRGISEVLAAHGIGVVGFNSRAYLADKKTPDRSAADITRVVRAYMARWHGTRLMLVGYSRGADMLPFVVTRLPEDLRARTTVVAMLGLARGANFHFHFGDMFHDVSRPDDIAIAPELARLRPALPATTHVLCVYGQDEKDSGCRDAGHAAGIAVYPRTGGHHFDGDDKALGELIYSQSER